MHCLAGLDTLTSGQVFLGETELGLAVDRDADGAAPRAGRVRVPVVQPDADAHGLGEHHAAVRARRPQGRRRDANGSTVVIRTVGLGERLRHRPSELSGGQQQRVAIARALATRPDLVFADEPTGNLDSTTGAEVLEFLRAAVRDMGQTVVMVTHDPVAAGYADSVVFLADGRTVGSMDQPTPERVLDALKTIGS